MKRLFGTAEKKKSAARVANAITLQHAPGASAQDAAVARALALHEAACEKRRARIAELNNEIRNAVRLYGPDQGRKRARALMQEKLALEKIVDQQSAHNSNVRLMAEQVSAVRETTGLMEACKTLGADVNPEGLIAGAETETERMLELQESASALAGVLGQATSTVDLDDELDAFLAEDEPHFQLPVPSPRRVPAAPAAPAAPPVIATPTPAPAAPMSDRDRIEQIARQLANLPPVSQREPERVQAPRPAEPGLVVKWA